jgi:hypothetical protein
VARGATLGLGKAYWRVEQRVLTGRRSAGG